MRTVLLLVLGALSLGCYRPRSVVPMDKLRLPLPTKDEVALVDNLALSVTDYLYIRSQLKSPSSEKALWVGTSMLAIQSQSKSQGKIVSSQTAFDLARYAIGELPSTLATKCLTEYYASPKFPSPEAVKGEIEALSKQALVRRNPIPLSQLN